MRILQLDAGHEMRGGQWQALRLHRGLLEAGHDSFLLAQEGSPLYAEARRRGVPVDFLRPLALALQSRRYDLLHAHDSRSHSHCAMFARVPFVVSRRVAFPVRTGIASRWKYGRPAMFLAVSHYVAHQLHHAGIEDARVKVVYDGVPVPDRPAQGDRILAPWSADPAKGMALAEQAALLAGVDIQFTRNLEADLPSGCALVYLSRFEGLGSGILLAMAYGLTVIASRVGGIPEIVQDGVNGILVPNEARAVADAFPRVSPELGLAARRAVMDRYTVGHMVQGTLDAYAEVLAHA